VSVRGASVRLAALALIASVALAAAANADSLPWSGARQLVLVVIPDWNSLRGELRAFERSGRGWRATTLAQPVVIGRAGAAWGIGLHGAQPGPVKKEGDGRSPAGAFAIGTAFGYAPRETTALPYLALGADDWCIDVAGSPLYNRIVNAREVGKDAVEGSSEPMRRDLHANGDPAYEVGFVIEHNANGAPGAGSCIFAHVWKSADTGTAGCTAMPQDAMRRLLRWLRPDAHPVFVLLPQSEYGRLRKSWDLPDVAAP
jgi:L,D-peptidoglycan transpeptidase YkuD (ErfK/YbiS/YcfS/YnhG family)